jgi:transposase
MSYGRNRVLTGDERKAIAARVAPRYEAGASIRAIARREGRSYKVVRLLLLEAGVTFRPRGGDMRSPGRRRF